MTDDTGILEHSVGSIPRRKEGYSTDDQARALWACIEWLDLVDKEEAKQLLPLIDTYLAFLLWVQTDEGHFHNNIAYDRSKEQEIASDDCLGRCFWACALSLVKLPHPDRQLAVKSMLDKLLPQLSRLRYPRGFAYALAAGSLLIRHQIGEDLGPVVNRLAQNMADMYRMHSRPGWYWFEPIIAYGNGVMPWGMFCAYEVTKRDDLLAIAKESLDFLISVMTNERQQIRPVGNHGWCTAEYRAMWDQQPIDVMKLALAAAKAYEVLGSSEYRQVVERCHAWFFGENDAGLPMVNEAEGSCYDALCERSVNGNQGAESTISFLLTEAMYVKVTR
jgi:hypothetical protein